jgi:ABC-type Fe3+-hydroxamate transport system substrate-binding protein
VYRRFCTACGWSGILAGWMVFFTLACHEQPAQQKPRTAAPAEPSRIVSLSPDLSRLLVEFGLAAEIVGVDSASRSMPEFASAADLGGLGSLDASAIASLKPNFVFALAEENQIPAAARMRELGIPLYAFNPTSANGVIESIQDLGIILGREERARSAVRRLTREISKIATERDGEKRPKVAWILRRDPLVIVGNRGLLHHILELAGGEIALHRLEGERIEVSFEELAASEPDLILDSAPTSPEAPIATGVRTEMLPASIGELPTLDLLGRIRIVHELLFPVQ